jgi:hypothetical protein
MTLVATPYSITELGESEERHEIGNFMDVEGFDCRGYHGELAGSVSRISATEIESHVVDAVRKRLKESTSITDRDLI